MGQGNSTWRGNFGPSIALNDGHWADVTDEWIAASPTGDDFTHPVSAAIVKRFRPNRC
jgi:hypothetical protein